MIITEAFHWQVGFRLTPDAKVLYDSLVKNAADCQPLKN
jgi:hypothetical protein